MTQAAFDYVDGTLHAERVSTIDLAERFGTPLFVYSRAALTAAYEAYAKACAGRRAPVDATHAEGRARVRRFLRPMTDPA
ncbi:diaminopimelate decarboxylase [Burkholderia pseudomallei]|nr:diaminopimelate decarboxylase [Burkholderia pseudomallei]